MSAPNASLDYDPFSAAAMSDPQPLYRRLRDEAPVFPLPRYDGYALSRFAEIWDCIQDSERCTLAEGPVYFPEVVKRPAALERLRRFGPERSFSSWDPPAHTAIRAALSKSFRPHAVARFEPALRALARERAEQLRVARGGDLVRDFAAPVAVTGICAALGLPLADGPGYWELSSRASRRADGQAGMSAEGLAAQRELFERVLDAVRERRGRAPAAAGPCAIDALQGCEIAQQRLDDAALATQLVTLLVGGSETLPKLVAGGARELARQPAQRAALASAPAQVPGAFEEIVRHQGVLQAVGRTALQELEIADVRVRPGQRLFLLLQSANRDEREFPEPERFDVSRRPRRSLGFGQGAHHCIGIHLARLEGRILFEELLRAIPSWEVDEAGCERPPSEFQIGYTRLPIIC